MGIRYMKKVNPFRILFRTSTALQFYCFWQVVEGFVNECAHGRNRQRLWAMGAKSLFTSKSASSHHRGKATGKHTETFDIQKSNVFNEIFIYIQISKQPPPGEGDKKTHRNIWHSKNQMFSTKYSFTCKSVSRHGRVTRKEKREILEHFFLSSTKSLFRSNF